MKTAVLLTGISAATLLFSPSGFAQYTAAEATTTISAAETVNQSQQAPPARDPRFTSRYGNAGAQQQARQPQPPAQPPVGQATKLAAPATQPQAPAAPARDPRFTSRYGNAGASRTAPPQAPSAATQSGSQQQPAVAAPIVIPPRAPDPDREQRIVDFQLQKAISGNPTSQYDIGIRYLKGDGLDQDRAQALNWLKMADQGGNSRAKKQLELIAQEPVADKKADDSQPAKSK